MIFPAVLINIPNSKVCLKEASSTKSLELKGVDRVVPFISTLLHFELVQILITVTHAVMYEHSPRVLEETSGEDSLTIWSCYCEFYTIFISLEIDICHGCKDGNICTT